MASGGPAGSYATLACGAYTRILKQKCKSVTVCKRTFDGTIRSVHKSKSALKPVSQTTRQSLLVSPDPWSVNSDNFLLVRKTWLF